MDDIEQVILELMSVADLEDMWDQHGPTEVGKQHLAALRNGERVALYDAQKWILQFADRLFRAEDRAAYLRRCNDALRGWMGGEIPPLP